MTPVRRPRKRKCDDEATHTAGRGALQPRSAESQGDGQQRADYTTKRNEWGAGACRGESYIVLHIYIYIVLMNVSKSSVNRYESHIEHTCCCCYCSIIIERLIIVVIGIFLLLFFEEMKEIDFSRAEMF